MHLSERGTVEVELVVDHFVYSFLHFVHIVDGHYFCCTLVRELQPTVSLSLRFAMSAFHTRRYNFTEARPRCLPLSTRKCGKAKTVTHFRCFFYDRSSSKPCCLRLLGKAFTFHTPTPLRIYLYGSLHSRFFFALAGILTTHPQITPNCAVSSKWELEIPKLNGSNQCTISDPNPPRCRI